MRAPPFFKLEERPSSLLQTLRASTISPVVLTLCALVLWGMSVSQINLRSMDDLGLISVLPPAIFAALGLMTLSYCLVLHQPQLRERLLFAHIAVLILMLYGVTTFVEEVPRFHVTWRHVGISEYISRTGDVDPRLNAYFNWPGFFVLTSFLSEISGYSSTLDLAVWATVFFNVLYLGPLLMIFSAISDDRRLTWLGVWFFYLTNWIGQDYFAPQALNYFFYLVILATVLTWFRSSSVQLETLQPHRGLIGRAIDLLNRMYTWLAPTDAPAHAVPPAQRAGLVVITVLLFAAMVPSHQLTPVVALGGVVALVALNRCSARSLPLVMGVIFVTWLVFMTTAYLAGHFHKVIGGVGEVTQNVSENVTKRVRGSPEHLFVVQMRLVMTAIVAGLAFVGGVLRWRRGRRDLSLALITVVPFGFVLIQPYGGEMLLRAYLFALPGMVFFGASLFYPTPTARPTAWKMVLVLATSVLLLFSFLITRYGNERINVFSEKEAEAVEYVYQIAPPNSLLIATSDYLPWKYEGFGVYRYRTLTRESRRQQIDEIVKHMDSKQHSHSYFILTRSQKAFFELFIGVPPGEWEQFEALLLSSGKFQMIYSNEDAKVLTLTSAARSASPPPLYDTTGR